jgi:Caspase recruitment domain
MHLTFADAFRGKHTVLAAKLEVSDELLRKLMDKEIILPRHVSDIENARDEAKVGKLLEILQRRDDSLVGDFCKILESDGQRHVKAIILQEEENSRRLPGQIDAKDVPQLEAELKEILEPDYGLLETLYRKKVIESEQCETVCVAETVHRRVEYLLKAVKTQKGTLKDSLFLEALKDENQNHVLNFIKEDGNVGTEYEDDHPLSEQQRRRFSTSRSLLDEMNFDDVFLQVSLCDKHVINRAQRDDVMAERTPRRRNIKFLRILSRRSLADVKQFIKCLYNVGQRSVVQQLTDIGVLVYVRTVIGRPEMNVNEHLEMERKVVQLCQDRASPFVVSVPGLESSGCEIVSVEISQSLAWYVKCQTVESLESLRLSFETSPDQFADVFERIFNGLLGDGDPVKLVVEWSVDDYESCRSFFSTSSGMPFGPIYNDDGFHGRPAHVVKQ